MLHWQAKLLALVACALLLSAARARAQERPITWTLKVNSSARAFKPGDTFKVYYSLQAPKTVAPCNESRPAVDGWVCK